MSARDTLAAKPRVQVALAIGRDGTDHDWRDDGLCATGEYPHDIWFPSVLPGRHRVDYSLAVEACRRCPSKTPCLQYALDNGETEGVWGGLTPSQRDRLARRRRQDGAA